MAGPGSVLVPPPYDTGEGWLVGLPHRVPDWVAHWPDDLAPLSCGGCACDSAQPPEPPEEVVQAAAEAGWAIPGVTWDREVTEPPAPSPAVAALQTAVDEVCRVDPAMLSPEQAWVDSQALLRLGQQLRVHDVRRLADVKQRELYAQAGFRSTAAWLREQRPDADPSDAGLAARLVPYQVLAASVQDGATSLAAARKVLNALARCRGHVDQVDGLVDGQPGEEVVAAVVRNVVDLVSRCLLGLPDGDPRLAALVAATERILADGGGQLVRLEAAFTLLAAQVPLRFVTGYLDELVLAVVPSMLEDRARRGEDNAGVSLRRKEDGSGWRMDGDLDLECGERLFTALMAEARRDPANAADTDAAAGLRAQGLDPWERFTAGSGAAGPAPRPRRRRLHDALHRLLERYLEHGLGGSHQKVPVQVNVTIEAPAVDGRPGSLPPQGDSGAAIARSVVRRWWCDSRVTAFVLSRGGKALRAVHTGRTLTAAERRAAALEHGNRCAGVGCCRGGHDPTVDLRPHHVRRYADDGVTSLEDTLLVCDVLHRDIHEGGRRVRLRDGRYLDERGWAELP